MIISDGTGILNKLSNPTLPATLRRLDKSFVDETHGARKGDCTVVKGHGDMKCTHNVMSTKRYLWCG